MEQCEVRVLDWRDWCRRRGRVEMGGLQEETSRRLPGSQDFRAWIFLLASHGTQVAWHDFWAETCSLGKSWDPCPKQLYLTPWRYWSENIFRIGTQKSQTMHMALKTALTSRYSSASTGNDSRSTGKEKIFRNWKKDFRWNDRNCNAHKNVLCEKTWTKLWLWQLYQRFVKYLLFFFVWHVAVWAIQAVCAPCFCIFWLRHFIHREARSIIQSLFPYAKEGGIGFRRGLASIQWKFENGLLLSYNLKKEGNPGDDE